MNKCEFCESKTFKRTNYCYFHFLLQTAKEKLVLVELERKDREVLKI